MHISTVTGAMARAMAIFAMILSVGFLAPSADAHHSYAMYDGTQFKVFTGVMVRIIPNAAHFEMHMVPLNDKRDALVKDEKGEPLVWVLQMESAAQALRDGITKEAFPQGTVFSMGFHPLRDGKRGGDRGAAGLFQCPKGSVPKAGMHCDSVPGSKAFGKGVLKEGKVTPTSTTEQRD
jgi:hypothetical protein